MRVREVDTGFEMRPEQTVVVGGMVQTRTVPQANVPSESDKPSQKPDTASKLAGEASEEVELLILITPEIVTPPDVLVGHKRPYPVPLPPARVVR